MKDHTSASFFASLSRTTIVDTFSYPQNISFVGIVSNLTVCGSHTAKQIHTFPATEISDELNMNKLNQIQGKYVVFDLGHSLSAGKDNGVVQSFVNISWLQTVSELKSARTEVSLVKVLS